MRDLTAEERAKVEDFAVLLMTFQGDVETESARYERGYPQRGYAEPAKREVVEAFAALVRENGDLKTRAEAAEHNFAVELAARLEAEAALARLREALKEYGIHTEDCAAMEYDPPRVDAVRIVHINRGYGRDWRDDDAAKCDCGLARALAEGGTDG